MTDDLIQIGGARVRTLGELIEQLAKEEQEQTARDKAAAEQREAERFRAKKSSRRPRAN